MTAAAVRYSGWDPSRAKNLFAGHTVYSIVLEVPDSELLAEARDGRRIGVWALATLARDAGSWRSINRVGLPMIHPLFTQFDEELGDRLNAGRPADDFLTYGGRVSKAIARVVAASGTAEDPQAYGERVAHRFFPNVLPTRSARRPHSASPAGTAARSRTTPPTSCSASRRTRRSISGSARNPSPRSRRGRFPTSRRRGDGRQPQLAERRRWEQGRLTHCCPHRSLVLLQASSCDEAHQPYSEQQGRARLGDPIIEAGGAGAWHPSACRFGAAEAVVGIRGAAACIDPAEDGLLQTVARVAFRNSSERRWRPRDRLDQVGAQRRRGHDRLERSDPQRPLHAVHGVEAGR